MFGPLIILIDLLSILWYIGETWQKIYQPKLPFMGNSYIFGMSRWSSIVFHSVLTKELEVYEGFSICYYENWRNIVSFCV